MAIRSRNIDKASAFSADRFTATLDTLAGAAKSVVLATFMQDSFLRNVKLAQVTPGANGTSWAAQFYKQLKNDGAAAPKWGGTAATAAQAKVTFSGVVATDVVTVNGQAFTCVASGATAVQFNKGADDAHSMANFVAAINAATATAIAGKVTASDNGDATCQLTALVSAFGGYGGNAVALAKTDGHSGSAITLSSTVFGTGSGSVAGKSQVALLGTPGAITLAAGYGRSIDALADIAAASGVTAPVLTATKNDLKFEAGDVLLATITPTGTYSSTLPLISVEATAGFLK